MADLLPIEVDPVLARATVEMVPFWFHTIASAQELAGTAEQLKQLVAQFKLAA